MWIAKRAYQGYITSQMISAFYWTFPPLFAYIIIFLSACYNPHTSWMKLANKALSGRLVYGHKALTRYGYSLFGTRLTEHGWGGVKGQSMSLKGPQEYFFVDSSFLRMMLLYGIIAAIVVIIIMIVISRRSIMTRQYALAGILVIVTVSAVVEQRLLDLSYDPFLIALVASLPSSKTNWEEHDE